MHALLESFGLDDSYEVIAADAMKLRCLDCGDTVSAGTVDIHERTCDDGGA